MLKFSDRNGNNAATIAIALLKFLINQADQFSELFPTHITSLTIGISLEFYSR